MVSHEKLYMHLSLRSQSKHSQYRMPSPHICRSGGTSATYAYYGILWSIWGVKRGIVYYLHIASYLYIWVRLWDTQTHPSQTYADQPKLSAAGNFLSRHMAEFGKVSRELFVEWETKKMREWLPPRGDARDFQRRLSQRINETWRLSSIL